MSSEADESRVTAGQCDGCGSERGPFFKLSMGKDFFGRSYDRLSPSADQSPKWYCESCSMQKNLQRDFRDIREELNKLSAGQRSELADGEQLQRARLRLHEIFALLGSHSDSRLLAPAEVRTLIEQVQARLIASPIS